MEKNIFDNEKWWQEQGENWDEIVNDRRKRDPLYSIQEIILSSYMEEIPHSKVLEFGVGFGRHATYLTKLKNIEFHGVDQSPTMLESLKKNVSEYEEIKDRIILIEPRSKLPYPDNYFDVVYTVSVLIHIQPEHLKDIMQELIRVSKHKIIHFENSLVESTSITSQDHNGCWAHPLVDIYKELNEDVNVLSKSSTVQDVYIVDISKNEEYQPKFSEITLDRLKTLDKRIKEYTAYLEGEVGWMRIELAERQNREIEMKSTIQLLENKIEKYENSNDIDGTQEI